MNEKSYRINKFINSFFLANTASWILFAAFIYLYNSFVFGRPANPLVHCISFTIGFVCTVILRSVYRSLFQKSRTLSSASENQKGYSIFKLTLLIILLSLIAANLWYWMRLHSSLIISPPADYTNYEQLFSGKWLIRHSSGIFWNFIVMMVWSGIYFIIKLRQDWILQVDKTEKAKLLTQSAHMQMLRYQISPHFLFNSLNTIRALILEDKKQAKDMITEVSEFLKYTLTIKEYMNVPLRDEIEAVKHYLAIEKKRYEQKLEVFFDIDEKTLSCMVLNYLIHPLIEEAVTNGFQTGMLPLKITLATRMHSGVLEISVLYNNISEHSGSELSDGMKNVRRRLEINYPDKHQFEVFAHQKNTSITIRIKPEYMSDEKKDQSHYSR